MDVDSFLKEKKKTPLKTYKVNVVLVEGAGQTSTRHDVSARGQKKQCNLGTERREAHSCH